MKNTAPNIPRRGFAIVAAASLLFVLDHFAVFAEPSGESEGHAARPEFYFVRGEVNVPQRYVYTNGLTLAGAIKRAKGLTAQASATKVSLTRAGDKPLILDVKAIERGKAKDIQLKPGDQVFVPRK